MELIIRKAHIQAVMLFAGKKDIRYYLNGACIDTGEHGAHLVATDGHTMAIACISTAPLPVGQIIIPRAMLDGIKSSKKDHAVIVTFDDAPENDVKNRKITINNDGIESSMEELDGRYPDYRRVIPKTLSGEVAQFQIEYLMRGQKAAEILGGKLCEVLHNGSNTAVLSTHQDDFLAIVMPLRGSGVPAQDWIAPTWYENAPKTVQEAPQEENTVSA
ncbi:DNA polymerase III, beta chain, central [uncultured Caudovirales phage]|uniref:DNA polymerase III, beta chain, central n=1 Tax=uncultured Caudovirales phage TaxID=2100421 RepID=A0A6J5MS81_9CAUD|nr:DNA polymerase III, beta chain, central [uncultured Caudovirales phage]